MTNRDRLKHKFAAAAIRRGSVVPSLKAFEMMALEVIDSTAAHDHETLDEFARLEACKGWNRFINEAFKYYVSIR